jgi:hypothetical protein
MRLINFVGGSNRNYVDRDINGYIAEIRLQPMCSFCSSFAILNRMHLPLCCGGDIDFSLWCWEILPSE